MEWSRLQASCYQLDNGFCLFFLSSFVRRMKPPVHLFCNGIRKAFIPRYFYYNTLTFARASRQAKEYFCYGYKTYLREKIFVWFSYFLMDNVPDFFSITIFFTTGKELRQILFLTLNFYFIGKNSSPNTHILHENIWIFLLIDKFFQYRKNGFLDLRSLVLYHM